MNNHNDFPEFPIKSIVLFRKDPKNGSQEEILLRNLRQEQGMTILGFYPIAELCFWIEAKLDCPECFQKE